MSYSIIGERIGVPSNNFTILRLLASYAVLYAHSYALSIGTPAPDPLSRMLSGFLGFGLGDLAVIIFFIVSGFLVGGSYIHRNNIFAFLEARFLRIFPALFVAVALCVIVGAFVTSLPLSDYFKHQGTWSFFWHNVTLFNGVQFALPSVFESNPIPRSVNGSLWTLPLEVYMYGMVMLLGALGILSNRAVFNGVAIVLGLALMSVLFGWVVIEGVKEKHMLLFLAYLSGVLFYVNKNFIPLNWPTLVFIVIAMFISFHSSMWRLTEVVGIAYIVLFIALHPSIKLPSMDKYGDYSYGVYIYAFPVQQLLAQYVTTTPLEMVVYTTMVVVPLAILSWRFIEKPALQLKGKIPMGRKWLDYRVREVGK